MTSLSLSPDQIVMLIIEACGGSITGKTLLQKRAYFISNLLDIDLDYRPHYYGPYSPDIDEGVSHCKALGFIEEQTLGFGMRDPVGFEVRRYDYSLTSDGKVIVKDIKQAEPADWKAIQGCCKRMKSAGDTGDYVILSIAAKTHCILKKLNISMTMDEISNKAQTLGWDIKPHMIDKAATFLENLSLVTRN
jgi:hypothetical protein